MTGDYTILSGAEEKEGRKEGRRLRVRKEGNSTLMQEKAS